MSRAFLRDDAEGEMPRRNYALPERDDPEFDRAAALSAVKAHPGEFLGDREAGWSSLVGFH